VSVTDFDGKSVAIRLLFALLLVFLTYNPEGYSYYHWVTQDMQTNMALKGFSGVVLLIGWAIYIRATFHALGAIGIILAVSFFGTLVWVIIEQGWIATDNIKVLSYLGLFIVSWVITTGLSWSFIRRKISGQYDVVETDDELNK